MASTPIALSYLSPRALLIDIPTPVIKFQTLIGPNPPFYKPTNPPLLSILLLSSTISGLWSIVTCYTIQVL
jgi:hypothetical protein